MKNISKRVYEVLIGNSFITPASGAFDPSTLTSGQLAVYDQNRDGGVTTADSAFYFAQYDNDNGSRSSMPIGIRSIISVSKTAYAAAANQVSTLTIASSDVQNNTVYWVEIVDKRDREYVNKPKYSYQILSTSAATSTNIATALRDAINADKTAVVTATASSNVLTITGKDSGVIFDIVPIINGGFTTATTTATTTSPDRGNGTYEIVYEAEDGAKGYKGNMNRVEFPRLARYFADANKTYVTYTIRHYRTIDIEESPASNENKSVPVTTFVYIDSTASSSITALDTFFNTTLGLSYV